MWNRLVVLSLLLVSGVCAQQESEKCRSLLGLTATDLTILRAEYVAATAGGAAHCRVEASALPEVRVDVYLPIGWNKRFLMRGNGGFAGTMDRGGALSSIRQGFAVGLTDTGHDAVRQPLGTFAVERQKLYDYAFRSLHLTVVVSKRVMQAFYGVGPEKSFYVGCSTGGRQGLMLAQRFPEDFDGIVAGAPVLDFSGTMTQYLSTNRALRAGPLTLEKVKQVGEAVYAKCDALDGLKDGLIVDPAKCPFVLRQDLKLCGAEAGAHCFTDAQIRTLETIYAPVMGPNGVVMDGWPLGAETLGANGRPGWAEWIVKEDGPSISHGFGESFFRYLAPVNPKPQLEFTSLDVQEAVKGAAWLRQILDAVDPDLSAFRKRGGKLLMYYGLADPALNANMGLRYFEAVQGKMGADVSDFFHYLTMPGVFHCNGGPGCGSVDWLGAIVDWVEKGKSPEGIVGAQVVAGKEIRKRPLCSWPKVVRYQGTGDVNDAASFVCSLPASR
jgi:pimeloyl-ACP methyl ester carboxylesterase